jgi:TRAP-type uncharacterized transport system substrate-binding protein
MATGTPDSAYHELGVRYRAQLARHGVELRLVTTNGDVDNLARLTDSSSGVDVAFLCSGMTSADRTPELVALGTVCYAPLWVFYRGELGSPADMLNGKRVSIGPEGSGTRKLALELLASAGLDLRSATVLGLTQQSAADAMQNGELDVALMLAPWESAAVRRLLASQDVNTLSYPRADAHIALHPFLHRLIVPRGVADLEHDRPPNDVVLVAPKVSLVARADLHPALQYLLLHAAAQIHSQPGIFQRSGQFPAAEPIDLPLSEDARQYYHSGTPFFQRYLPFWIAAIASQLLLLLIPVIGIVYPLFRVLPTVIGWGMRRPIFALYRDLKRIEDELEARDDSASVADLSAALVELEANANHKRVPLVFTPLVYTLRHHIELVQARLDKRAGAR